MIDKEQVRSFFDSCASSWDDEMIKDDRIINTILDNAGVREGSRVLDVACGTGVLFPYYLERRAGGVIGIDISPRMAAIAGTKYPGCIIKVVCGDAESFEYGELFDSVIIYNAFPHFSDPDRLINRLAGCIVPGGKLTVAHGMSRDAIDRLHGGAAQTVSNGLVRAEELKKLLEPFFDVDVVISDDRMYQVAGTRKQPDI